MRRHQVESEAPLRDPLLGEVSSAGLHPQRDIRPSTTGPDPDQGTVVLPTPRLEAVEDGGGPVARHQEADATRPVEGFVGPFAVKPGHRRDLPPRATALGSREGRADVPEPVEESCDFFSFDRVWTGT